MMMGRWAEGGVLAAIGLLTTLLFVSPGVATAAESSSSERPGQLTPNQLVGGRNLTPWEAQAACGPAAAVAFSQATGRPVSLDRAVAVARQVGWTPEKGMTGPYGELALLKKLGVPATLEAGVSSARVARDVQTGRPVIIRTGGTGKAPGHYFVAERYDAASGRFDLAQSALVLKSAAGRRWFTIGEIAGLGTGSPTHAIYLATSPAPVVTAMSSGPGRSVGGTQRGGTHTVDADGMGANARSAPGTTAGIVTVLADGARVTVSGAPATASGRTWRKITTSEGTVAWIDASLLKAN
jgi:hypothetical protein